MQVSPFQKVFALFIGSEHGFWGKKAWKIKAFKGKNMCLCIGGNTTADAPPRLTETELVVLLVAPPPSDSQPHFFQPGKN